MLKVLAYIYEVIVKFRYKLYQLNILKSSKLDGVYVICIGNITAGGTGKTPAVHYFAEKLLSEGKKCAVLSRGYMGKRKEEPLLVSDGIKILSTPEESGDEAYLHALTLKCPVVVAKNRYAGAEFCKKEFQTQYIIMDDGFQHIQFERDKNIILIDSTNPFGGEEMLPLGRLREPLSGLKRADEFIITKSDLVSKDKLEEIIVKLKKYGKKISKAIHSPGYFLNMDKRMEIAALSGKKAVLFSGIASPQNFKKTVLGFGVNIVKEISFRDHYIFKNKDILYIEEEFNKSEADVILTTEKDFVKIEKIITPVFREKLYILKIEFKILEENI